jgi:hypothetical protein
MRLRKLSSPFPMFFPKIFPKFFPKFYWLLSHIPTILLATSAASSTNVHYMRASHIESMKYNSSTSHCNNIHRSTQGLQESGGR